MLKRHTYSIRLLQPRRVAYIVCLVMGLTVQAGAQQVASPSTQAAQKQVLTKLPFADARDFDDAKRGWVGSLQNGGVIENDQGRAVWDLPAFKFLESEEAPATVNPSLWRQERLNMIHGLFKVNDHIYQIRGHDLANMTIVEGDTGIIIIDPLLSVETAKASLALYYQHRPKRSIKGVIYTHSHVDHFGGVRGVLEGDVANSTPILAPEGFMEAAISENIFAGNAMSRRAEYMYGPLLDKSATGLVGASLGKGVSTGRISLLAPTDVLKKTGEKRVIDGVEMEFQMAAGTEAPAEMMIYFPQWRVLNAAEVASHNLHNLYTIRGAQVRNAKAWSGALDEAIDRYGNKTDIIIAQHHWPKWGQDNIVEFLEKQRDAYQYIHDQSLRLANQGYTMTEVGNAIQLPKELASEWHLRDYYGTVNHNAKAVYQYYLGWYDGNPANLNPLPNEEVAKRYLDAFGGAQKALGLAKKSYDAGDYRWTVELLKHVVFADPSNQAAKSLQADAFEQLGYQSEASSWRNAYLQGAQELRKGVMAGRFERSPVSPDMLGAMTDEMLLDLLAVRLNGDKASGTVMRINWIQPTSNKQFALTIKNAVFHYKVDQLHEQPDASIMVDRPVFIKILLGLANPGEEIEAGRFKVSGDEDKLGEWLGMMDQFNPYFNIVTP